MSGGPWKAVKSGYRQTRTSRDVPCPLRRFGLRCHPGQSMEKSRGALPAQAGAPPWRQRPADLIAHRTIIALVRGPRRFDPAQRLDPGEVDRMAGLLGELLEIEELGPAVSLAEGMDIVNVADDGPGFPSEFGGAEVL